MDNLYVFRFYIDDADAESFMFGCTAENLEQAETRVEAAGYREWTLFDQTPLELQQRSAAAAARIDAHPFLGPEWQPLVEVVSYQTKRLHVGEFWTIDTLGARYGYDAYRSPFVQAILEADGSLHVEVGGRESISPTIKADQDGQLALLGWATPSDAVLDDDEHRQLPLASRLFEPGWNAKAVAEVFLEALTLVFRITSDDFFTFGEANIDAVADLALLEQIDDGPIFALARSRTGVDHPVETVLGNPQAQMDDLDGPSSLDSEIRDEILLALSQDGLEAPYVSAGLARSLKKIDKSNFGSADRSLEPIDLYLFNPATHQILEGNWEPRVQFGFAGHGMNSYAWTYLLVSDGIAVLVQSFRGFANFNATKTQSEWSELMNHIRTLHEQAVESDAYSPDQLLFVAFSAFRGVRSWQWLSRDAQGRISPSGDYEIDDVTTMNVLGELFAFSKNELTRDRQTAEETSAHPKSVYPDAETIVAVLFRVGLADSRGALSQTASADLLRAESTGTVAQVKKIGQSWYSGGDVVEYFLSISVLESPVETVSRELLRSQGAIEGNLVGIVGPGYSIVVARGDRDAEIPNDIAEQLVAVLADARVVWERVIPEAEWFEVEFDDASAIIDKLVAGGLNIEVVDPRDAFGMEDAGDYVSESIPLDDFATATFAPFFEPEPRKVTLQILLEEHWADSNPDWLEAYLPYGGRQVFVTDDGWVIRIVGTHDRDVPDEELLAASGRIQSVLGGHVIYRGARSEPSATGAILRQFIDDGMSNGR